MLKDGLCAGYLAPFGEMLYFFFSSFMVLFDPQIQAAAPSKVMPRRDVFPHISLHFPYPFLSCPAGGGSSTVVRVEHMQILK